MFYCISSEMKFEFFRDNILTIRKLNVSKYTKYMTKYKINYKIS